ncbi:MAG: c-type cytochrome [Bythopirellula sp.]
MSKGANKAGLCMACHGQKGISINDQWPNLSGQKAPYLEKQIKAFRDGGRVEPTMHPLVANLCDDDIEDLAAFYASLSACE